MTRRTVAGMASLTLTAHGWEFLPTPFIARLHLSLAAVSGGIWVAIGIAFCWTGGSSVLAFFGLPMGIFTVQMIWYAVHGWRLRTRPLIVEPSGRVRYGDEELCPAGSVETVRVVPDRHSEGDGHKVLLRVADGSAVELPPPYFQSFLTRQHALQFAGEIASALNVGVVEPA